MSIQQPEPPSHIFQKAHRRQRKPLRKLFLICLVVVIALLISVLLILNGMGILPGPWTLILTTITTLTGIVLAVFQAFPSLLQFSTTDLPSPQHETFITNAPVLARPQTSIVPSTNSRNTDTPPSARTSSPGEKNMQDNTKDFFISYAEADVTVATWIAGQLEGAGYSTHVQAWDISPGSNSIFALDEATKQAERTILVLSPHYFSSFEDHPEWTVAFSQDLAGKKRKVLPIYVAECSNQPKGLLGPIVPINLVGLDEESARQRLLDGVCLNKSRPTPPPFPSQP